MIDGSTSSSSHQLISPTTEYQTDPETGAAMIPLGGNKYPDRFALVDPCDVPLIEPYKWRALPVTSKGDRVLLYARGYTYQPARRDVYMHRVILGLTDRNAHVDHINHDPLDNRRVNLRVGSHQQNIFNRRPNLNAASQYKGVSWHAPSGKWQVHIRFNGKQHHLGLFNDEREAAEVYDGAALTLFGSRAYLNFPDGEVR